jgi:hypothetical protein
MLIVIVIVIDFVDDRSTVLSEREGRGWNGNCGILSSSVVHIVVFCCWRPGQELGV